MYTLSNAGTIKLANIAMKMNEMLTYPSFHIAMIVLGVMRRLLANFLSWFS